MIKIGITGGIATGKSTVSAYLRSKNYCVIDADIGAREVVKKGTVGLQKLVEMFGETILLPSKELNRPALATLIFNDEMKRQQVDRLLHPLILVWMYAQVPLNEKIVFFDVPLLFEVKWHQKMDSVWVVSTTDSLQLERLMARNQLTEQMALQRIQSQMPLQAKEKLANVIIYNNESLTQLYQQVDEQLLKLKQMTK